MYYGESSRGKIERGWIVVFMCATVIFLWMLMLKVDYMNKSNNLNLEKVNYKRLVNVVSLVSSFDIALIVSVILLFKNS